MEDQDERIIKEQRKEVREKPFQKLIYGSRQLMSIDIKISYNLVNIFCFIFKQYGYEKKRIREKGIKEFCFACSLVLFTFDDD
jgi:hypothetical protein